MLDKQIIDEICEKNNFYCNIDETMYADGAGIEISQYTPEGEDWYETFEWNNNDMQVFLDSLKSRIDGWDSEDEAMPYIEMRGKNGVPSSVRDLLDDADWKLEQLKALYTDLINYDANNNYTTVEKKTEARLTDYLGILEIRDILQQNPATADKEFAILDDMKVEVGVGDDVKVYKAIKNDEGNWELLEESKHIKTESASYKDFVTAGESLWGEDCSVYDTVIDGIFDCSTAGHGGYLVDTTIFPELAKYGDKSSVANIVGFEEDYEALKVLWVFPQLIKSEDFKNKLNLDMVLAYDEDKSFAKEFPTMGGNISMNENKLNEALQVRCKKTYNEDGDEYWSEGNIYTATNLDGQNWSIITNFGNKGKVGPDYMLDNFDDYFEVLEESKECIKETKLLPVEELPDMCYGVLPSDNSIIIIKKGETGYWLTNKDYANQIEGDTFDEKYNSADELANRLNAQIDVTPEQRFSMEIRSMNGNWEMDEDTELKEGKNWEKVREKELAKARKFNDKGNKFLKKANAHIDKANDAIRHVEESKKLQEEISDEVCNVADKIAEEITKVGIMNFKDIDDMAIDLLGIDSDTYFEKELNNDIHVCLNYKGISNNWGNGDFFTQEYADKHPEILEESKSMKTESEAEYRAVRIMDASESNVDYGVIMLNKKHSVKDFQKAMWDAYERNRKEIEEYGDDLSKVLADIDPSFDWYEIEEDSEYLTI